MKRERGYRSAIDLTGGRMLPQCRVWTASRRPGMCAMESCRGVCDIRGQEEVQGVEDGRALVLCRQVEEVKKLVLRRIMRRGAGAAGHHVKQAAENFGRLGGLV